MRWWNREIVGIAAVAEAQVFDTDPEAWFNTVADAWNEAGFVVAQGDGLFMHSDPDKWGSAL